MKHKYPHPLPRPLPREREIFRPEPVVSLEKLLLMDLKAWQLAKKVIKEAATKPR